MDANKKAIIEKRIMKTGENLRKNNMEFHYAPTAADVKGIVENLLNEICYHSRRHSVYGGMRYKNAYSVG